MGGKASLPSRGHSVQRGIARLDSQESFPSKYNDRQIQVSDPRVKWYGNEDVKANPQPLLEAP